ARPGSGPAVLRTQSPLRDHPRVLLGRCAVTNWAARRAMPDEVREDFTLLAGEHAGPESVHEDPELTPFAEVAELVAAQQWPRLYDVAALEAADVRGAAAVYFDDAYVPVEHSLATAEHLSGVK